MSCSLVISSCHACGRSHSCLGLAFVSGLFVGDVFVGGFFNVMFVGGLILVIFVVLFISMTL